jgi:hypothetical protein
MKLNRYSHGHLLDDGTIDSIRELYADCPNKDIAFGTFFKRHSRGYSIEDLARPVTRKLRSQTARLPKGKLNKTFFDNRPELRAIRGEIYIAKITLDCDDPESTSLLYKIGVTTNWKRRKGELAHVEFEVLRIGGRLNGLCEIEQAALTEFKLCRTSALASTGIDGLREEIFEMNEKELKKLLRFVKDKRKKWDDKQRSN